LFNVSTIVRAVPSLSIAPLTFRLIVVPAAAVPADRVPAEFDATTFEAATLVEAATFAALATPPLDAAVKPLDPLKLCPPGIVPLKPADPDELAEVAPIFGTKATSLPNCMAL
jgi:hypothetical protein